MAWLLKGELSESGVRIISASVMLLILAGVLMLPLEGKRFFLLLLLGGLWVEMAVILKRSFSWKGLAIIVCGAGVSLCGIKTIEVLVSQENFLLLGLLCTLVWISDSTAYFVGRQFGGAKLAPRLSPKKTWSGAIGGLSGGILWGMWYIGYINEHVFFFLIVVLVFAQVGDLAESAAKRFFGVKDSSHVIPGHGGLWDRLDGLIFASLPVGASLLYDVLFIGS